MGLATAVVGRVAGVGFGLGCCRVGDGRVADAYPLAVGLATSARDGRRADRRFVGRGAAGSAS